MWMNEFDIENAVRQYGSRGTSTPMGAAVHTLHSLMTWTNGNSDGWPYWAKPARAATKLMELIDREQSLDRKSWGVDESEYTTAAEVMAALRSVKAFRTRHKAGFDIFVPTTERQG